MLAQLHGEATETGTMWSNRCTLPQPVQRQDELRAKKAGACAGVMTKPVSPTTVSTKSVTSPPEVAELSIDRPRIESTVRLQSRTAARASAILPIRFLPQAARYLSGARSGASAAPNPRARGGGDRTGGGDSLSVAFAARRPAAQAGVVRGVGGLALVGRAPALLDVVVGTAHDVARRPRSGVGRFVALVREPGGRSPVEPGPRPGARHGGAVIARGDGRIGGEGQ